MISKFKIAGGLPYKVFPNYTTQLFGLQLGTVLPYGEQKNIRAFTLYKIEHAGFSLQLVNTRQIMV